MSSMEDKRMERMRQMEEAMAEMRKSLDAITAELKMRVNETAEMGRERIREKPLMSVGLAFGVGLIFGAIMVKALGGKD